MKSQDNKGAFDVRFTLIVRQRVWDGSTGDYSCGDLYKLDLHLFLQYLSHF